MSIRDDWARGRRRRRENPYREDEGISYKAGAGTQQAGVWQIGAGIPQSGEGKRPCLRPCFRLSDLIFGGGG